MMTGPALSLLMTGIAQARAAGALITAEAEILVARLFQLEGRNLVRLARLFVDDRDAAEDLVQEAFIRLARHASRITEPSRAPAYLRSIVLNLARDHNRRGLVSLRHQAPAGREIDAPPLDETLLRDEAQQQVLEAVRALPLRQRDCVTLRYYLELDIEEIASTLGLSANSVKTHLKRGLANLERSIGAQS
jgi:RNA polymerase sigma factor (sigma-70 family)